jgi:hypothetical protein
MLTIPPQGYLGLKESFDSTPRITFDIFLEKVSTKWMPYAIGIEIIPF